MNLHVLYEIFNNFIFSSTPSLSTSLLSISDFNKFNIDSSFLQRCVHLLSCNHHIGNITGTKPLLTHLRLTLVNIVRRVLLHTYCQLKLKLLLYCRVSLVLTKLIQQVEFYVIFS